MSSYPQLYIIGDKCTLSFDKRYFIIDQQIARHFVQNFQTSLSLYATQIIITLLLSQGSANHDKG